jgi:hypothetical protein
VTLDLFSVAFKEVSGCLKKEDKDKCFRARNILNVFLFLFVVFLLFVDFYCFLGGLLNAFLFFFVVFLLFVDFYCFLGEAAG